MARRLVRPGRLVVPALLAVALLATPACASARSTHLTLGFSDGVFMADAPMAAPWLARAARAHADIVRLDIGWPVPNTPTRPVGFDARNPADPAYDFTRADAAIVDATSHGLRVLVMFTGAPRWAEGPGRPANAAPGTWRPDPQALHDYGAALARRYSGSFPDPARPGHMLPRVAAFQVWNEPNLDKYLTPQWVAGKTFAPVQYRHMLTAFYRGVKSVSRSAIVVTAGTAPFGDPFPGGHRIMPVRFVRDMLCVRETNHGPRGHKCSNPARFDVLSHHPYSVGTPRRHALNADDVSIPDIGKLTRVLHAAEHAGGALPHIHHRIWVTEVSYDSSPPDPQGVPIARHARNLEQAFYLLWHQGVDTIFWYQIHDQLPVPSYAATVQSGVYFADGRAKPALRAFRFPFVAERVNRATLRVWGRAPATGKLRIERRVRHAWRVVRTIHAHRHRTFFARVPAHGRASLRARVGTQTSLTWPVGVS